jgi:hypothetical protein
VKEISEPLLAGDSGGVFVLGVRLKASDILLAAVATLSSVEGKEVSSVIVPFGGKLRCVSEAWHWYWKISSYRKRGREKDASRGAGSRKSRAESSKSWAFVGRSAPAGRKRGSTPAPSDFELKSSGEMGKTAEKERGNAGSLTLKENPLQPKKNMEALIRKKTFFRKDPFPPLLSERSLY